MSHSLYGSSLRPLGAQVRLLVIRLLLAFALYSVCRGIFYLYNRDLLEIDSMKLLGEIFWGGLRFDLSALLYTNLLLTIFSLLPIPWAYSRGYQRMLSWLFRLVAGTSIVLNLGDTVYYRFTLRRTTMAVFEEFGEENPFRFLRMLWDYWPMTLLAVALVALVIFVDRRLPRPKVRPRGKVLPLYFSSTFLLAIAIYMSIVGGRGGFTRDTRPITLSNANAYIQRPQQRALVLNTPFSLVRTIGKQSLPDYQFMPESEVTKYFSSVYTPGQTPLSGKYKGRNVVLIIWESFAREWVGGLNGDIAGYKGFTPFVDSLLTRSYVFERAYANGGKSIDAMPSIFTSIIKPHVPFVLSIYSGNKLPSLPSRLDSMGYATAFFHGAPNGSMGFDAFTRQVGIQQYYGMKEYGHDEDFDGNWGIWDEKFLQYVAGQLGKLREPFFAAEFTLSSHHPFLVPKQYQEVLPKGTIPMHQAIAYADMSLRKFFETASRQPWYDRTLFVIVADHAVPGALPEYKTSIGVFRVPIIIFDPRGELTGRDAERVVSQADLYPTILDLVGDQRPMVAFGSSAFDASRPRFMVSHVDGTYQMVEGDWLLQFDGQHVLGFFDMKKDPLLQRDLKGEQSPVLSGMLLRMKAYLQDYAHRMKSDQLTVLHPQH